MNVDLADPIALMLAAARAFERAGIEAAAYGGLVLAVYGTPRETKDADLAISTASADAAQDALTASGLAVSRAFTEMKFGGCTVSRLTVIGGGELNTVDLVRPRSARFATALLGRALVGTLRGESLRVVSAEDYVILKVLATRDRDLEDAQSVLDHLRGRLDESLVRGELAALAGELTDHDVLGRFAKLVI